MNTKDFLEGYDPNGVGQKKNNIFGLPFATGTARLVFIPVPWDVTVSNCDGTSLGPQNIYENSFQIDLFAPAAPDAWRRGMAMEAINAAIIEKNIIARRHAKELIAFLEQGGDISNNNQMQDHLKTANMACEWLMRGIGEKADKYIENRQLPFLVGGEHSISGGLITALSKTCSFGILQIDAHADMRYKYQGFEYSHASVMHRALHTKGIEKIVQVGIRDLCPQEMQLITENPTRITTFFDHELHRRMFHGENWAGICNEIVSELPDNVYVTFDIDGLQPELCPGTGTPVPGGLSYNQALYLVEKLLNSGRRIIGADLVETGTSAIDGTVACRILFQLASMMIKSNE